VVLALAAFPPGAAAADDPMAPPGAASCTGCHAAGPASATIPGVHGRPAEEIAGIMREYREGARPATLMNRIAKGFTEEETRAIAAWLAARGPEAAR
jgi:cytochrome c553